MRKITFILFFLVASLGFSQETFLDLVGDYTPASTQEPQKATATQNSTNRQNHPMANLSAYGPLSTRSTSVSRPLSAAEQQELLADQEAMANRPVGFIESQEPRTSNRPMADITPTAGTIESFTPAVGDHFFDPGGPGGTNSDGGAGNYPNCGCATQSTLLGVSEIKFNAFNVFATFDYLRIYDGTDDTGTLLYDNGSGGLNSGDILLSDMIASHGSDTFTSTSGDFFFYFHASSVVNREGWDVEIMDASGGGGGPVACGQSHPYSTDPAGGSGSSVDSDFKTAADIVVAAGEDFTLDTIEVPFLTFAPEDAPITANVVYYADASGLPGAMIGSETVVPTIVSSGPWVNPVAFQFKTSLAVTPFTFTGDASSDTTYWIEVSMGTATNQGTVFWEYTDDLPVEGHAYAKFDATLGSWEIDEPSQEVIYTFSGECETIGGGGGDACAQETASNGIENGWGNISLLIYGSDFVVAEDEDFTLEEVKVNFLLSPGNNIVSADIFFYEDTGGNGPGTEIVGTSSLGAVPDSQAIIGNHPAGFDQVEGVWTLDTPVTFEGSSSGDTVYWMGMQIEYAGASAFMETSSIYNTPNEAYFSNDGGVTWTSGLVNFGDDMHGVITFSGQCEAGGGGGPSVYCIPEGTNTNRYVENFSTTGGIENISNMGSGFSTGGYGDFYDTHTVAQELGEDVEFTVDIEGGISGFRIWVDWNQDGVFDTTEEVAYASTSYENSQSGTITVPADALEGDTRMRIVSHWLSTTGLVDPCETGFTYGEFEDYKFTVGGTTGGPFPEPYCAIDFSTVEPITNVEVAGIENRSSAVVGGSPALEDFTAVEGVMEQGTTYTITLEGNTAGNWNANFVVFIDWNQNGILDDAGEIYVIDEMLSNSTGEDGKTVSGEIVVPADAMLGSTRMRVKKTFGTNLPNQDPCVAGTSWGQAEDYTIVVEEGLGISDVDALAGFSFYPNPTSDMLNLNSNKNIESVTIYNLLGQQVFTTTVGATSSEINVSHLSTGAYVMKVSVDGQVGTYRVMKE